MRIHGSPESSLSEIRLQIYFCRVMQKVHHLGENTGEATLAATGRTLSKD